MPSFSIVVVAIPIPGSPALTTSLLLVEVKDELLVVGLYNNVLEQPLKHAIAKILFTVHSLRFYRYDWSQKL